MAGVQVLVEVDVARQMRDGTVLRADIYRPADDARHPVLLLRTPYGKQLFQFTHAAIDPIRAARAGYVVVIQDARGRFASEGSGFEPYRHEAMDGYDTAQWVGSLPCSDGRVGVYGISYMGGSAWLLAAQAPPALTALAAAQAPNDQYNNVMWRGGAFMWGTHLLWSLGSVGPLELLRELGGDPRLTLAFEHLADALDAFDELALYVPPRELPAADPERPFFPYFYETMAHTTRDDFYATRSTSGGHHAISVPALIVSGWYDVLLGSDLEHFAEMRTTAATAAARSETRLVVGPWTHGLFTSVVGELDFGMRANGMSIDLKEDITTLHLRWFDRWLRDGGEDDQPRVKLFVQGINRWRDEDDWPLSRARATAWYLVKGGGLARSPAPSADEQEAFVYDPADPCPTCGGTLLLPRTFPPGPIDQRPLLGRRDVLVFTSDYLEHDLEITGPVVAVLYAATSGPDTDWVVKLCDVHEDGRTLNLCDGVLRARFRDGDWAAPTLVEPDRLVRYEIDLWATSAVLRRGHRLRILVTSSDFPRYDRNPNTGEDGVAATMMQPAYQRIHTGGVHASHIILPVVS